MSVGRVPERVARASATAGPVTVALTSAQAVLTSARVAPTSARGVRLPGPVAVRIPAAPVRARAGVGALARQPAERPGLAGPGASWGSVRRRAEAAASSFRRRRRTPALRTRRCAIRSSVSTRSSTASCKAAATRFARSRSASSSDVLRDQIGWRALRARTHPSRFPSGTSNWRARTTLAGRCARRVGGLRDGKGGRGGTARASR